MDPENKTHVGNMHVNVLKDFDQLRYLVELETNEGRPLSKYQLDGCKFNESNSNWLAKSLTDYIGKFYDFTDLVCPTKKCNFLMRKAQERNSFKVFIPPIFSPGDNVFVRLTLKARVSKKSRLENIFVGEERFIII